jgi:hypothetical protein
MDFVELRQRVGAILAVEERANRDEDWGEVERLTKELQAQLEADRTTMCPEIVDHYLDDVDIRAQDDSYAQQQRERVRQFVETGEYDDGTLVPLWTCAVALTLVAGLVAWWLL